MLREARPPLTESMPADYRLLMTACWAGEPEQRPTAPQVLECLRVMTASREAALAEAATLMTT